MGMTERNRLIGGRIREARMAADLSQAAVAERMRDVDPDHQWSQATVWALEKGERALRAVEVEDLARAIETGSMYLFSTTPPTSAIRRMVFARNDLTAMLRKLAADEWQTGIARLEKECDAAEKLVGDERWAEEVEAEFLVKRIAMNRNAVANFKRLVQVIDEIGVTGEKKHRG